MAGIVYQDNGKIALWREKIYWMDYTAYSRQRCLCSTDDMEMMRAKRIPDTLIEDTDSENTILDYGIAYERFGFRYGFILAVRIMAQCINEIPVSVS